MNQQDDTRDIDPAERAARLAAILAETRPIERGDLRERLAHLCGSPIALPPTVRVHPHLPHTLGTDEVFGHHQAAVLPLYRGNGEVAGMEVLYLSETGVAPVFEPWQAHWVSAEHMQGAFFPVSDETPGVVAVAVGVIEATAIWRAAECLTVCAVGGAAQLAAFDWPTDTIHIDIYVTDATEPQGNVLAQRAQQAGLTVEIHKPTTPGATWFQELAFAGAVPCDEEAQAKAAANSQGNQQ